MRTLLLLVLTGVLYSCLNEKKEDLQVIDTEASIVSSTNLSEVFHKVEHISLGITKPLISRIFKIIKTKECLFVGVYQQSGIQILQFDGSGNYIKK